MKVSVTMKSASMPFSDIKIGEYFVFELEQKSNVSHGGAYRIFVKLDSETFIQLAAARTAQHMTNASDSSAVYLVELTAIEARVVTE